MILVEQLSKRYGSTLAVDRVSFKVNKGEILGLVGPNGAGKTTILNMIATATRPSCGNILVNGYNTKTHSFRIREMIGYVPQTITLYDSLTVSDNLMFWGRLSAVKIPPARIRLIAGVVGLQDTLKEKVNKLSGGMQRRLNIAVALLHDPAVLIMDEPTLGVDIKNKTEIVNYIRQLTVAGKTVVYTSHDLYEIEQLCHRVVLLNRGKLMYEGTLAEARRQVGKDHTLEEIFFRLGGW